VPMIPLTAQYSSPSGAGTVGQTGADLPTGPSLIPPHP
jgi:hypothetical protein